MEMGRLVRLMLVVFLVLPLAHGMARADDDDDDGRQGAGAQD